MKKNRKLRFGVVGVIVALLLTGCNAGDKKTTSVEEKTEVTTTVVTSREETPKWIIDIAEEKKKPDCINVFGGTSAVPETLADEIIMCCKE